MGLVAYDSDTDESGAQKAVNADSGSVARVVRSPPSITTRKRKPLPSLPDVYTAKDPRDDSSLHQGRKRTRPFVVGDYDAHVYIKLKVPKATKDVLERIEARIKELCPEIDLVSLLDTSSKDAGLHISLTHPLALRQSQIPSFRDHLVSRLSDSPVSLHFQLTFAGDLKVYYNGTKTGGQGTGGRAFLAFRVGAGHREINEIVENVLHPLLGSLHLPLYHSDPEYHASFAWCLVDQTDQASKDGSAVDESDGFEGRSDQIPIPHGVLARLNEEYRDAFLRSQPREGWSISDVALKIGKDVQTISLRSA